MGPIYKGLYDSRPHVALLRELCTCWCDKTLKYLPVDKLEHLDEDKACWAPLSVAGGCSWSQTDNKSTFQLWNLDRTPGRGVWGTLCCPRSSCSSVCSSWSKTQLLKHISPKTNLWSGNVSEPFWRPLHCWGCLFVYFSLNSSGPISCSIAEPGWWRRKHRRRRKLWFRLAGASWRHWTHLGRSLPETLGPPTSCRLSSWSFTSD